jgi:hypothetical protein
MVLIFFELQIYSIMNQNIKKLKLFVVNIIDTRNDVAY